MFVDSPFDVAAGATFLTLLLLAAVHDVRARRIPNGVIASAALLGLAYAVARAGAGHGLLSALAGFAVGLAIWLPGWALGMIGAGDVKLFAAGSVWIGPGPALSAALLAALFGGVLAIVWVVIARARGRGGVEEIASPVLVASTTNAARANQPARATLPYGVAISAGLVAGALLPHLLR